MNDIYCKDKARIEHGALFKKDISAEYVFTPLEEKVFSSGDNGYISAIINEPFVGAHSIELPHSLKYYSELIHQNTPVTDYKFNDNNDDNCEGFETCEDRENKYCELMELQAQCHLDIMFSDIIPGMTLIMDHFKNGNESFINGKSLKDIKSSNCLDDNSKTLSLIYITDTTNIFGYGSIIYTNRGLKSLSDQLKMYLFSNTYIVSRSNDHKWFPDDRSLKTSCIIIYKDSLERVLKLIDEGV